MILRQPHRAALLAGFSFVFFVRETRAQDSAFFSAFPASGAADPSTPPTSQTRETVAAPFGSPGQVVFTGASSIGVSSVQWDQGGDSDLSIAFSPGIDWFFHRNVSLGIDVDLAYSDTTSRAFLGIGVETIATRVAAAPRLGVNFPIGSLASFYPRLEGGFEFVHSRARTLSANAFLDSPYSTRSSPFLDLYAPLLVHPAPHLFVGLGPAVFHEFASTSEGPAALSGQRTNVLARFVLGGYWGGSAETAEATQPAAPVPTPHRFGDGHEVVLTAETSAFAAWTTYQGSDSSSVTLGVTPGIDYFVAPRVSLGIGLGASYTRGNGVDPLLGPSVTTVRTMFSVGPRLGVDIPIAPRFSFYPRLSVILGTETFKAASGNLFGQTSDSLVALNLYAPLLVHVAPHFFIGFGPSVYQDLWRSLDSGAQERATRIGAGLLVGGWL